MAKRLFLTDLDLYGNSIKNVKDPVDPQDVATKSYVDANAGGGGSTNIKIASTYIEDNAWVDNGDGSYSHTISLTKLGIADISATTGSEHIPQVSLYKKNTTTNTTENVDALISFADISDGTTTTDELKITINFAPTTGEIFYLSVVGKPA